MRILPRIVGLLVILVAFEAAQAAPTAFDTAGDSAYNSGWTAGSNGGYGWNGGWSFNSQGMATLGSDPSDGGIINSPASPLGRAWELTAGNLSPFVATRHTASAIQPGQVSSLDMDNPPGALFFAFSDNHSDYTLISTEQFTPNGPNDYLIEQNEQWFSGYQPLSYDSQIPVLSGPIHIDLTALSVVGSRSNFALQITSLTTGQSATLPTLFLGVNSGPYQPDVDTFYFGAGGAGAVYFNNISITPEPLALSALSICSLLLLKRRRNRLASESV